MKWDYTARLEVDTNDGDDINEEVSMGIYDDEDENDQKALAIEVLIYEHFEEDYGEHVFHLDSFVSDLKKFGLKPSDRCDAWKDYDALIEMENFDDLLDMDEDDIMEDDDDDDPTHIKGIDSTPNKDAWEKIHEWKEELEEEVGDQLPWMDNCDNNHSFCYEIKRIPAGTKQEQCDYNYDAKSYKDILTFESLDDDEEDENEDEE